MNIINGISLMTLSVCWLDTVHSEGSVIWRASDNSYGEIFESLPNLVGTEEELYATGKVRYEWELLVEKGGAEIWN